jgi:hypothetical protein
MQPFAVIGGRRLDRSKEWELNHIKIFKGVAFEQDALKRLQNSPAKCRTLQQNCWFLIRDLNS